MDKYQQLENRIAELEKWKADRTAQQITFPLDNKSIDILRKHFIHYISTIGYDAGAGANHFEEYLAMQGGLLFGLLPPSLVPYTANATSNYITTHQISGNLKFFDGFPVVLYSDGTAPAGLTAGGLTTYYVRDSDGYTFKLAATLGGAAIDITDIGSGRQFIANA